jgi:threonine dehydrogenase-like Zn-dependent dehydrogenase
LKAKAAVTRENARGMAITEYPVPDPGPEEVLIRVTMTSAAGNDRPRIQKRGQP